MWPQSEWASEKGEVEVSVGNLSINTAINYTILFRFLCGTCTISFKLDRPVLPEQPIKPDQPRIEGISERTPKEEFIKDDNI